MAVKPITTLRTSYRDVRVTAAGSLRSREKPSTALGAELTFAIMNRYARRTWLWHALNLIFRQFRSLVNLENVHHHSHTHLAPRLALTVVRGLARSESLPVLDTFIPVLQPIISNAAGPVANFYLINREHLVYRLSERYQQITHAEQFSLTHLHQMKDNATEGAIPARLGLPTIEPLPRTFRRSKSMINESEPLSRSGSESQASLKGDSLTTKSSSLSAPAIDVNRLTDQVIQAIDQRILAQRERLGRF